MSDDAAPKVCPREGCPAKGKPQPLEAFPRNRSRADGRGQYCCACEAARKRAASAKHRERHARAEADRVERESSDYAALKPEDFQAGVADELEKTGQRTEWARTKRQEYNRKMGEFADAVRSGTMDPALAEYLARLTEEERRFGNRRLARSVSIAAAHAELARQLFKRTAEEFFSDRVVPTGYALKPPPATPLKRTVCLLLSDLHFGANMDARGNPLPYREVEEARRFEYIARQALDYKPQYRESSRLLVLLNGDVIDGFLQHDQRAGIPLAEQKAVFWHHLARAIGLFAQQYKAVHVECQPGNHGRNIARHPGRATEDKWDGIEWDLYFALSRMCSSLPNVTWGLPFQAVSIVDLYGSKLGLTHSDTEVKVGSPDTKAKENGAALDRINSTLLYGVSFDAWAFGHHHTPRYQPRRPRVIWNGALVQPNGHARGAGYIGEPCGQWIWEAVEGYPVGDARFVEVGPAQDRDEKLGVLIPPFRFPMSGNALAS